MNIMNANLEENVHVNNLNSRNDINKVNYIDKVSDKINEKHSERKTERDFSQIIEIIFGHFSSGLRTIGPFFAFALVVFIMIVVYCFFKVILPYWQNKFGYLFGVIITIMCIWQLFNILFNYFLAVLVKPGSLEDIKSSRCYREKRNAYFFSEEIRREIDLTYILENNNIKINNILDNLESAITEDSSTSVIQIEENIKVGVSINVDNQIMNNSMSSSNSSILRFCNTCNITKPLRAHHCQICGVCIFKMDHHCPWINNCVGQNNLRYFVLFLTHTLIGCIFISLLSSPIFFFKTTKSMPTEFNFVCILCLTGCVLLLFFNLWNWFLVLNGNTTIEYFSSKAGIGNNPKLIRDFNLYTVRENIYMVFGTKSIFKAVFVPSIKMLPYSGLEWSRICDANFTVKELDENKFSYEKLEKSDEDVIRDIEI